MAILSFLLSFVVKKAGDILQAIFGWSVTALFGRLSSKKEMAVTVALALSIAWPVFVVGLALPGVASWVVALLPLESWLGPNVLRIAWATLAVISPPIVGLLTHWAAPSTKGGALKAMLHGYPLALGYCGAFLVTVVTVPIVKAASILRGWDDTHVYVQARADRYDAVVHDICEACVRAGLMPELDTAPVRMMLATRLLQKLAKGMVRPIVADEVKVVRAKGLEIYLYPADLLIRGKAATVAHVRAMLLRTNVDANAYLVGSDTGQHLQDELGRLAEVVRRHQAQGDRAGRLATSRLLDIWGEMNASSLPFDEWALLESIARRLERQLASSDAFPLDKEDRLSEKA